MTAIRRLFVILYRFFRYRLYELADGIPRGRMPLWLWLSLRLHPLRLLPRSNIPPAIRLRLALEDLGPVFVKFGQAISTREDLLAAEFAAELARLQDQVPAFPSVTARKLTAAALGKPLELCFRHFVDDPLASASVAQVHAATLPDGAEVVVKIIRPDVETRIHADLRLMHLAAALCERLWRDASRLHLRELVADYQKTIMAELNLLHEAANTATLRANFAHSELLYVPRVYWPLCRRNLLVMERIHGVPIGRVEELRALGVNLAKLAERGVEIFFTQLFRHNFFHADMHPGNIFVAVSDPENPGYIAVDCAIIGSLTETDQEYLARNLLAFFHRDYAEVARLHVRSGWLPHDVDPQEFADVIRDLCEPLFAKPLGEIPFGRFLLALFVAARRFDMEVQPQLALLQKTLVNIEGLGRRLYPELNLWETAMPFITGWLQDRFGLNLLLRGLRDKAPELIARLPDLPDILLTSQDRILRLERLTTVQDRELVRLRALLLRRKRWRLGLLLIVAVLAALALASTRLPDLAATLHLPW